MGLRMKNFGGSLKNPTLRERGKGSSRKTDIEGGLPKKGGLDNLKILGGAWQEEGEGDTYEHVSLRFSSALRFLQVLSQFASFRS